MRYLVPILAILFMVGCPKPDEDDPIPETNPQINIPWPSLGDTPWPMHHHDPQSTGRSEFAGPSVGIIDGQFYAGLSVSGITIGYDSTVFVSSYYPPYPFSCFDYEGELKWESNLRSHSTAIVSSDSIVYAGGETEFFAFTHDGDTVWHRSIDQMLTLGVNIDREGRLYFVNLEDNLVVLEKNGEVAWQLQDERILHEHDYDAAPTFSPDGQTLYIQGESVSLLAVDVNSQIVKWVFGEKPLTSAPVIDNDGNIYFAPGVRSVLPADSERTFFSINPEGEVNWTYTFSSEYLWDNTEPTIDNNGNIYFATDTLYSLNYLGELRWKVGFESGLHTFCPLISDVNNVIYVGTVSHNSEIRPGIMAFDETGQQLWSISDFSHIALGTGPAIAEDGTMFYPTWDSGPPTVFIIK